MINYTEKIKKKDNKLIEDYKVIMILINLLFLKKKHFLHNYNIFKEINNKKLLILHQFKWNNLLFQDPNF
ncbi:hypothetical protein CCP3SC1AL1_1280004 [Gammaproteobacteria bacterium]